MVEGQNGSGETPGENNVEEKIEELEDALEEKNEEPWEDVADKMEKEGKDLDADELREEIDDHAEKGGFKE